MFELKKSLIALSLTELTNKKKHKLLSQCDDKTSIFSDEKRLKDYFLKVADAHAYSEFLDAYVKADKEISRLNEFGAKAVTMFDEDYPSLLLDIDEPPTVLYIRGNETLLNKRAIAVVGTRKATRYGLKVTAEFTREFARAGLVVVSGFARGVDSEAHKVCVEEELPTIAVLGSGLNICYPSENRELMSKVLRCGGLFVSEYPLDTKPLSYHFPDRNRIVSGLSEGVFIPEATDKSGSLITAGFAMEQGRELFVVPGNINSLSSVGSNKLIRSMQGAIVLEAEDVLSALGIFNNKEEKKTEAVQLSFVEQKIVDALYAGELHFEELLNISECSASELSSILMNLELYGVVEKLSGNYYELQNMEAR